MGLLSKEEPIDFYSKEYFFRRCVEGLYRWTRDPKWCEIVAVISVKHSDQKKLEKAFFKIFRLSDPVTVLKPGRFGALFYGAQYASLMAIIQRSKKELAGALKLDALRLTFAAAPLEIEALKVKSKPLSRLSYEDLAKEVKAILKSLENHKFSSNQEFYYKGLS